MGAGLLRRIQPSNKGAAESEATRRVNRLCSEYSFAIKRESLWSAYRRNTSISASLFDASFERSPTSGCCSVRKPGRDLLLLRYHEHAGAHKGDPWERLRHHHSAVERENIESGRATYRVTVKVDGISAPKAGVGHTILIPSV